MNIDEHFDRVSRQNQNSNLNLNIAHLSGQTNVAVARMSTDDASRLKNSCSRPCLVGISVLSP